MQGQVLAFRDFTNSRLATPDPGCTIVIEMEGIKQGEKMWGDGATSKQYYRGSLGSRMAKQIYRSSSEVLINTCYCNEVLISWIITSLLRFTLLIHLS